MKNPCQAACDCASKASRAFALWRLGMAKSGGVVSNNGIGWPALTLVPPVNLFTATCIFTGGGLVLCLDRMFRTSRVALGTFGLGLSSKEFQHLSEEQPLLKRSSEVGLALFG